MHLYGTIGKRVDGDLFAQELTQVGRNHSRVNIRINSPGGLVDQGMSIISAILSTEAEVHTYVDGIAASMAAMIAISADKCHMQDFAKLMVHDPFYEGKEKLSKASQAVLGRVRDMLHGVMRRRGKSEEDTTKMMASDTWFDASEALSEGLIDEVVSSSRGDLKAMSPTVIYDTLILETQTIKKEKSMSLTAEATSALGIGAEASETEVSAAIIAVAAAQKKTADELKALKDAQALARKQASEAAIDAAIKDGRINAAAKESYQALFAADYDAAKKALDEIPKRPVAKDGVDASGKKIRDKIVAMSWDELDRGGYLVDLKTSDRELFNEKFEEKFGHKPKNQ